MLESICIITICLFVVSAVYVGKTIFKGLRIKKGAYKDVDTKQ